MITFNGRASNDPALGIEEVVTIGRPLAPGAVDQVLEIVGADGTFDIGYHLAPGYIPVRLYLRSGSATAERAHIRAIADWLSPREVKPLVFADEQDKQYYARRSGEIVVSGRVTRRFVDITFFCPDPYAYAVSTKTTSPNQGTAPTPVKITATMTDDTDHLQINLGDQHIRLETALTIGDEIIIDTAQGWVSLNGLDARQYVTYDSDLYMQLPTGAFTLSADNATLAIIYRERWL